MIGRHVDRYRIDAHLGDGGMATVWRATDLVLQRPVAFKVLSDDLANVPSARWRFRREVEIASLLDHPSIVPIYGHGDEADVTWMAMMLIDGETIAQALQRRLFSEAEACDIALQVCDALGHAHACGVVHRDITSRNVMRRSDGRLFLLDFGLARVRDRSRISSSGTAVGTPGYTAPEVLRGEESDPRSDLYGLGVVLFEMLTGRLPFRGERVEALSYAAQNLTPEPPSRYRPGLTATMDQIVLTALEPDPSRRHADCDAFAAAIRRDMGGSSVVVPAPRPSSRQARLSEAPLYLAVMPLAAEGDPAIAAPIAKAVTRALHERLSSLGQLHVVRESAALESEDDRDYASRVGANVLLKGRVRVADARVRAEFGAYEPEQDVWVANAVADGSTFDLFQLEDAAVSAVFRALGVSDAGATTPARRAPDPAAAEHFAQARRSLERHDDAVAVDGAIGVLERLCQTEAPQAEWLACLTRAYLAKHSLTKERIWETRAASMCHRALEKEPESVAVKVALGDLQSASGNAEEAERSYRGAIEADPAAADAWRGLARLLDRVGRSAESEDACRRAIALRPDDWRGYGTLGQVFYHRGDYVRAVEPWRRVMDLTPDNARGAYNLGSAYFHLDRLDHAIQAYRDSIQIRPSARAFTNLGTALLLSDNLQDAAEAFSKATALAQQDPEMWGNLGNAFKSIPGRAAESIAALDRAIALAREQLGRDPQSPELWALLADWLESRGRREEADDALARALEFGSSNVNCLIQAAHISASRDDRAQTFRWLEETLRRGYGPEALRRSRHFAALRGDPEFEALLARHSREAVTDGSTG